MAPVRRERLNRPHQNDAVNVGAAGVANSPRMRNVIDLAASPSRPGGVGGGVSAGGSGVSGGLRSEFSTSTSATNTEWESGSCEFLTAFPTEEKKITWRIKDFTTMQLLKTTGDNHKITFNAGQQVGMPSKWSFTVLSGGEDKIGLFLALEEYLGPAPKIFARFDSAIKYPKDPTKDVVNRTVQPTDLKAVEDWGWSAFVTLAQLKTASALVNDTVTIDIKFILYGKETVNVTSAQSSNVTLEQESRVAVSKDLQKLLETGENSDFKIRVRASADSGTEEYLTINAHKAVLAARSPVFQAMIASPMLESTSGQVTLEDLSPKGLHVFMRFLYSGMVDKEWASIPEEIVNAADKYGLPILKSFCDNNLHSTLNSDNAFKLLRIAKVHGLTTASKNITEFIKANVEGIMESF